MLKEIYFRDPSDTKYDSLLVETNSSLEALISKLKMIMFSEKGEILGEPELGLNLEDFLFDFSVNEAIIKEHFYAQIAKFIPERDYKIDLAFEGHSDGYKDYMFIYVTINGGKVFGVMT